MSDDKKSAYVIETSVGPGGSRWAEIHAYSDKSHIEAVLRQFCENQSMQAYHAIWYGADLFVYAVQRGAVQQAIDLHAHIFAKTSSSSSVRLDDEDGLRKMVLDAVREARAAGGAEDNADADDEVDTVDWDDLDDWDVFDRVELFVDWPAIEAKLAPLEAPLLLAGQRTSLECDINNVGQYLMLSRTLRFGSEDREAGARLAPPPGVDVPDDSDEEYEEDEDE
jgi:hypothetical protein